MDSAGKAALVEVIFFFFVVVVASAPPGGLQEGEAGRTARGVCGLEGRVAAGRLRVPPQHRDAQLPVIVQVHIRCGGNRRQLPGLLQILLEENSGSGLESLHGCAHLSPMDEHERPPRYEHEY